MPAQLLSKLDIQPTHDCIICPEHVTEPKPSPEGLLKAAASFNVKPEDCLYIGDHIRDIEAAKNASMASVIAAYGYIPKSTDIHQWHADGIAETPAALKTLIQKNLL